MYWVQALTQFKVINVVATLFMISRGLNLSQIFLTAIAYSIVAILSELPSSYLADKWSRKGLITISIIFAIFYWFGNLFVFGFWQFVVVISLFSISFSLMSGTDEAFMYDTARELEEEKTSLKMLGRFFASGMFFKIFTPVLAVLIASKLTNFEYCILIGIDLVANLIALSLVDFMVEPKHIHKGEKISKGVFWDSVDLFVKSKTLINLTFNRTLVFIAAFSVWRLSSDYFLKLGSPLFFIGLSSSVYQLISFVLNIKAHFWFRRWSNEVMINFLNIMVAITFLMMLINEIFVGNWILGLIIFIAMLTAESLRNPYFSDLINKESASYNRATTISGSNLVTEIIKLPAFALMSGVIFFGYQYLFFASMFFTILSIVLFSLTKKSKILIK